MSERLSPKVRMSDFQPTGSPQRNIFRARAYADLLREQHELRFILECVDAPLIPRRNTAATQKEKTQRRKEKRQTVRQKTRTPTGARAEPAFAPAEKAVRALGIAAHRPKTRAEAACAPAMRNRLCTKGKNDPKSRFAILIF